MIVETLDGRLLGRVGAGESLRVMGPHVAVERTRRRATTVDAETPAETVDDGIELVEGPREWLVQARGMLADGRDSEAVGFLEERADSSWRLRALLGDAYRLTGDDDQARFAYEEALDEAGDRPPASLLVDLGSLLSKAGEPEAVQVWERYLEEYPEGRVAPKALWQLARVEISRGELDASKDRLRRILADFPASSPALSALARLGRLHLDDHDWEAADGLFSLYVRSSRKSQAETALVGMIRVRMAQRRFAEARALVEEYGSNFPDGRRKKEVEHLEEALP